MPRAHASISAFLLRRRRPLQSGILIDKVAGADAVALTRAVEQASAAAAALAASASASTAPPPPGVELPLVGALRLAVAGIFRSHHVVLFMKGTPEAPKCRFSEAIAEMLKGAGVKFKAIGACSAARFCSLAPVHFRLSSPI